MSAVRHDVSLIGEQDIHLFAEGTHLRLHGVLGAHPGVVDGAPGCHFAVWAPGASEVSVIGDFNDWQPGRAPLQPRASSGIWEGFLPGVGPGAAYKYRIRSRDGSHQVDKADPQGFLHQTPPQTASIVCDLAYAWGDAAWMGRRGPRLARDRPVSIYEVHLGSWMRSPDDPELVLGYRELAPLLADHVDRLGFTHVELMPVMEHPFYGSWGYQVTGYFAASGRQGSPQDLMFLVDHLHQRGIGVILDWVPSHFPDDEHGLVYFDGSHIYEHPDRRRGFHPDWKSYIFDYGRREVQSFLRSSAHFWLDVYHADGLRVDGVASMLYLDYSRKEGEWEPNVNGGRENLEAIAFLRDLNEGIYREHPDVQTIAEESTSFPLVSRPVDAGGLGFGYKWDMGWMHDTLDYFRLDPLQRSHHHHAVTFRTMYAFAENFVLSLSHDEVVHGKGSLLDKMAGDEWQQRANLRLLLGWMYAQPGKKLLFMGGEFGQRREWSHDRSLDWHLLDDPGHAGLMRFVQQLNRLYREERALHEGDCEESGFRWIHCDDKDQSVVSLLRLTHDGQQALAVLCNFTPVPRTGYRVGLPFPGRWVEVLNSDASDYGGAGWGNMGEVRTERVASHGQDQSVEVTLPPLAIVFLKGRARKQRVRTKGRPSA
jgi:1,4-alpha-glucan branching enzyme